MDADGASKDDAKALETSSDGTCQSSMIESGERRQDHHVAWHVHAPLRYAGTPEG